eukprot:m.37875 g.37875  ORF g.37875 m.37875 type:complete len:422 (-) comp13688_c0_seq2:33-1298(-)
MKVAMEAASATNKCASLVMKMLLAVLHVHLAGLRVVVFVWTARREPTRMSSTRQHVCPAPQAPPAALPEPQMPVTAFPARSDFTKTAQDKRLVCLVHLAPSRNFPDLPTALSAVFCFFFRVVESFSKFKISFPFSLSTLPSSVAELQSSQSPPESFSSGNATILVVSISFSVLALCVVISFLSWKLAPLQRPPWCSCKDHKGLHEIFISYTEKLHAALATQLEPKLQEVAVTFLDKYCLKTGKNWMKHLLCALHEHARVVVILVSQETLQVFRQGCEKESNALLELEYALRLQAQGLLEILPVFVGNVQFRKDGMAYYHRHEMSPRQFTIQEIMTLLFQQQGIFCDEIPTDAQLQEIAEAATENLAAVKAFSWANIRRGFRDWRKSALRCYCCQKNAPEPELEDGGEEEKAYGQQAAEHQC